ncbi:hypothetical protein P154DRAFT_598924 [Amniculicola lignicola CBS 123094]|uniref:Uncharacterized protein n=1 Tax=Amniculicola lignicola CBS 123094 TaxID=1392246 RepID=A0A6A5WN00_9PLEO|nr:hypothetical protein P154DRAFT_598924 [Amniculicola lignicola CBS 123094]
MNRISNSRDSVVDDTPPVNDMAELFIDHDNSGRALMKEFENFFFHFEIDKKEKSKAEMTRFQINAQLAGGRRKRDMEKARKGDRTSKKVRVTKFPNLGGRSEKRDEGQEEEGKDGAKTGERKEE